MPEPTSGSEIEHQFCNVVRRHTAKQILSKLHKMESPEVIVIGTGPSGIAMAHTLKHKLGFDDFTVGKLVSGTGRTTLTRQ